MRLQGEAGESFEFSGWGYENCSGRDLKAVRRADSVVDYVLSYFGICDGVCLLG